MVTIFEDFTEKITSIEHTIIYSGSTFNESFLFLWQEKIKSYLYNTTS